MNKKRMIREASAQSGTSLLEIAARTGHSAGNLEVGHFNINSVSSDTGFTLEELEELGRD